MHEHEMDGDREIYWLSTCTHFSIFSFNFNANMSCYISIVRSVSVWVWDSTLVASPGSPKTNITLDLCIIYNYLLFLCSSAISDVKHSCTYFWNICNASWEILLKPTILRPSYLWCRYFINRISIIGGVDGTSPSKMRTYKFEL